MDPSALLTELRAAGLSEVDISARRRAEYSSDASLYRLVPTAVAFPRSTDEVLAALSVCRTLGVPLTARGAGTSIAGNAVGAGLVLDFSRHLNRITALDPEAETATVQPGVILDDLQRTAAPHGLRFGPDPSTHSRATLGGMIGNNACGSRALAYGRTADNVRALDLVAGNGERINAVPGAPTSPTLRALHELVGSELALVRTEFGRFSRQVSGYSLEHLLPERGFNVPAALVGTEGSCGVLLGATLTLRRVPASTVLVVLGYPDMASAADAVPALLPYHPIAMEGLDSRMVDVLPDRANVPELPAGKGWLFVELDTTDSRDAIASVLADAGTSAARVVDDPAQAAALWRIREDGAGLAARANNGHAGWEDAAVPPERLGAYLREFETLLAAHSLTGTPYGHFGDGCVHIRIDFPLGTPVFREFLTDAAKLVADYGGSCSGEHGDGRARGELLPLMYSREAIDLFARVKAIFDPGNLLNPGIVVRPDPVDAHLRIRPARPSGRLALR
ncbi:MAG TPA: FAD-binding oxidoreductase, partial [Pseudonocardiaceae bacterium]